MVPSQRQVDLESKVLNALLLVFTLTACGVNTLLLIRISKNRKHFKAWHMPLLNIVISNTLCSYFSLLLWCSLLASLPLDSPLCHFSSTIFTLFFGLSSSSTCLISIERYFHMVRKKIASFEIMFFLLVFLWIAHLLLTFYPLMVDINIAVQAFQGYCLPDFRRSDLLHRIYSVFVVTSIFFMLGMISTSYYKMWRSVVAESSSQNFKPTTFGDAITELPKQTSVQIEMSTKSDARIQKSAPISFEILAIVPRQVGFTSKSAVARNPKHDYSKQLTITKKMAAITVVIFLAWLGNLCSFLYQISTENQVTPIIDWCLGILHFVHYISTPLIFATMQSEWRWWSCLS
ncbi:hypothetical protein BKA69DRAFT_505611 [Paraphysoderma sedebokerense]|nr:hypothetical protein BKA69DRAFT_505611 [Paraphysoderma sedebokerense]